MPSRNMLEFNLISEKLILFSPKAAQVKAMIDYFITEIKKVRSAWGWSRAEQSRGRGSQRAQAGYGGYGEK